MASWFKMIFRCGIIAGFPLFTVAVMTTGFQDPIPLMENWWTGASLIWSGFFYGMIAPFCYRKYPSVFKCLLWVGVLSLLFGVVFFSFVYSFELNL